MPRRGINIVLAIILIASGIAFAPERHRCPIIALTGYVGSIWYSCSRSRQPDHREGGELYNEAARGLNSAGTL